MESDRAKVAVAVIGAISCIVAALITASSHPFSPTPSATASTYDTHDKTPPNVPPSTQDLIDMASTRVLTDSDLAGKSKWEVRLIRNAPYARHGYAFTDAKVQDYFATQGLRGTNSDQDAVYRAFTETERQNVAFVSDFETRHGYKQ